MLYLRTLLSPRSRSTQEAQVNSLLSKVGVVGSGELKLQYGNELLDTITKSLAPEKFMKALLAKLTELETPEEKAKMLAMIHCAIWTAGYEGSVIEELSSIVLPEQFEGSSKVEDWFIPFYRAYTTYLVKLPSVGEVYARARSEKEVWYDSATLLVDLFRLMNQLNLILSPMISMFNTVGRYYVHLKRTYTPMYKLLRRELELLYDYMQRAIESLFASFESIPSPRLQVFLDSVPEMEIMVDQLEEFLMNKYFEGRKPLKRIYFKAVEVAKVDYYLKKTNRD